MTRDEFIENLKEANVTNEDLTVLLFFDKRGQRRLTWNKLAKELEADYFKGIIKRYRIRMESLLEQEADSFKAS